MKRWQLSLIACVAGLAAGCGREPPPVTPTAAQAEASRHIQAVEPRDMAQEVSRRPLLKWKLPATFENPIAVSFALSEVGQVDDPRRAGVEEKQVGFASGLHHTSPAQLDPFDPPPGCVLTGDITDKAQLAPLTWYHWKVRAITGDQGTEGNFYFRTRAEEATPTSEKPAPGEPGG